MKLLYALIFALVIQLNVSAQKPNPVYDSSLAKKLNGNDNGMKRYVLVMLKTGSNITTDKKLHDSLFGGHMNNLRRMADMGKLTVAGPLGKNDKTYRGIFIFNVETFEEAEKLLATDPAVANKLLDAELYSLWCTAALQEIPEIHLKLQKNINP
ncbi:MAG: hypothetical protein ABIW38_07590 [Ferruginibacter sp.]